MSEEGLNHFFMSALGTGFGTSPLTDFLRSSPDELNKEKVGGLFCLFHFFMERGKTTRTKSLQERVKESKRKKEEKEKRKKKIEKKRAREIEMEEQQEMERGGEEADGGGEL